VENHLITVREAASALGVSQQYVRRMLRQGKLHGMRLGRIWLIERSSLRAILEIRTTIGLPGVYSRRRPR
jgi:excisionase family DNA binding protein